MSNGAIDGVNKITRGISDAAYNLTTGRAKPAKIGPLFDKKPLIHFDVNQPINFNRHLTAKPTSDVTATGI